MPLTVEIITPDETVYAASAHQVVLPTEMGETGVLPGHVPLVTKLVPGEVRLTREEGEENLAVDIGFARVMGSDVTILTEAAIDVKEIDLSEVDEARDRAEKALQQAEREGHDAAEIERLQSNVRFAIAQRLAKGRRRG